MRRKFLVPIIATMWFGSGVIGAGWYHASMRAEFCNNYTDPQWSTHRVPLWMVLFGPVSILGSILSLDFQDGWTLTAEPTTHAECADIHDRYAKRFRN